MNIATKSLFIVTTLLFTSSLNATTQSSQLKGCAKKINDIELKLAQAKYMDNSPQVGGLEISLKNVKKHCNDDVLISDVLDDITQTKQELRQITKKYNMALAGIDAEKIEKYAAKVDKKTSELQQLKKELAALI